MTTTIIILVVFLGHQIYQTSVEEREDNENANINNESDDLFVCDGENEGTCSQWPYLCYALGLSDFPEENETNESSYMESDDGLTSDNKSEVMKKINVKEMKKIIMIKFMWELRCIHI